MSEPTGKLTPKGWALAALAEAMEEAQRQGGPRPLVMAALLHGAQIHLTEVQELARPRRAKKDKESA